ncbi:MAG: DNA recombination protein RmuC [Candidatus Niyogibacteria bacterium CG10_big_fil_rev_8_21_14_0_10_46_36]|uniref:DNA recombination protein RmuC n=1 Tax=Candidatus Niyogibacteria bacterium CG10_big_fil_rev_8_21_14_0_10_46_36 TaxID=1974726 RepID=A0A2H0TE39_9BACT|nr:MAG: DNA recombination protein RmuC [Candidatus Niyogibacteria bacterium CG10_big_fil_rev_8_21_14_0_10_46_36]
MYLVLGILIGAIAGGIIIFLVTRRSQSFLMLQHQLQAIDKRLDEKLGESGKMMQAQFGESAKIIRDVTERLTKLDETNKQVINFTDQLRKLQDILQNPKQRGILGEYYLETVLKNTLPVGSYKIQYGFRDGNIVDAAIFIKDKIIPVDSKFSLENYNRILEEHNEDRKKELEKQFRQDLKNRIDETAKYVRPEEGTMDFAFMFIPSEAIYYDLLINKVGAVQVNTEDLISYAINKKRVLIVSPNTFLAFLQTVLQGLKAMEIEESAKEIIKGVQQLSKHITAYDDYMLRLGKNLDTTVNAYNKASKEFKKIDKDVVKLSGSGGTIEPMLVRRTEEGEEIDS